jgi:long-chain acyl-CoA synthetase
MEEPSSNGEYIWKTYKEVDKDVEALSRALIKRQMCPLVKSDVKGTPDLKFIGIFSENRPEFFITELACISDSVTVVPISVLD